MHGDAGKTSSCSIRGRQVGRPGGTARLFFIEPHSKSAFNTPTVVHFCTALLLAAILSVPWPGAVILSLLGLGMVIYMLSVMWRMRRVPDDQPPFKDWLWYLDIPLAAYIVLILAAVALPTNPALVLYIIGAVMVSLLFTGIHNAWDLVTYLAIDRAHPEK